MSRKLSRLKKPKKAAKIIQSSQKKATIDDLINAESNLGRTLFGPIPEGHRREFFQHKKNLWVWHESWRDQKGQHKELTVRYEVRPSGVFKKPLGGKYIELKGSELENFRRAVHVYAKLVKEKLYQNPKITP